MATITTVTSVIKNHKTVGYQVSGMFVTWSGTQYSCSCGKNGCEHSQAVISQIRSERTARMQHDKEIAERAQAKQQQERRETAPLYRKEFSLLR